MNLKKMSSIGLCIVISIATIIISLITSFELAAYSDYGFYQKEYEKYGVLEHLDMEMEDVMDVTKYMMTYLHGGEEVLSIEKEIEGEIQDFFNEQDRFHMDEVRTLFLGGLILRRGAAIAFLLAGAVLLLTCEQWKLLLVKTFQRTLFTFCGAIIFLGGAIAANFTKVFIIFHEIFFDNDLWIFDSRTDYMIRMLPEGFFYDMVLRIGTIFLLFLIVLFIGSVIMNKRVNKDK